MKGQRQEGNVPPERFRDAGIKALPLLLLTLDLLMFLQLFF